MMLPQGEHVGTHMDAPAHFAEGKWRSHEIPFERLAGEAVVIDITQKANNDADAMVEVSDLEAWEKQYGRIPDGAVVVMYSGWGEKYADNPDKYFGVPNPKEAFKTAGLSFGKIVHYPGFSGEAARWLVKNRNIHGVASDTVSLDRGQTPGLDAHLAFLGNNIWGLENVAHVHKLRPKGLLALYRFFETLCILRLL